MSNMYYYEVRSMRGDWMPVTASEEPRVKDGRLVTVEGYGAQVRRVQKVPAEYVDLPLDEKKALSDLYHKRKKPEVAV